MMLPNLSLPFLFFGGGVGGRVGYGVIEGERSLNFPYEKQAWDFLPELKRLSSMYKSTRSTAVP